MVMNLKKKMFNSFWFNKIVLKSYVYWLYFSHGKVIVAKDMHGITVKLNTYEYM